MATLNLDKRRDERDDEPHKVTLDGREWKLPARLPLVVAEDLASGRLRAVIAGTFGAEDGEAAREGIEDDDKAQAASDKATAKVVSRLGRILDKDMMESVLDELYDLADDKPKKKARKEPQDHLKPAS